MKKTLLIALSAAAILAGPVACTTTQQQDVAHDAQYVANVIRQAETTLWTPQQFQSYYKSMELFFPQIAPYELEVFAAYSAAYAAGNLTVAGLEVIATKYDAPVSSPAAAVLPSPTPKL